MTPRRLFALDQNFPEPVCKALEQWLLTRIRSEGSSRLGKSGEQGDTRVRISDTQSTLGRDPNYGTMDPHSTEHWKVAAMHDFGPMHASHLSAFD